MGRNEVEAGQNQGMLGGEIVEEEKQKRRRRMGQGRGGGKRERKKEIR